MVRQGRAHRSARNRRPFAGPPVGSGVEKEVQHVTGSLDVSFASARILPPLGGAFAPRPDELVIAMVPARINLFRITGITPAAWRRSAGLIVQARASLGPTVSMFPGWGPKNKAARNRGGQSVASRLPQYPFRQGHAGSRLQRRISFRSARDHERGCLPAPRPPLATLRRTARLPSAAPHSPNVAHVKHRLSSQQLQQRQPFANRRHLCRRCAADLPFSMAHCAAGHRRSVALAPLSLPLILATNGRGVLRCFQIREHQFGIKVLRQPRSTRPLTWARPPSSKQRSTGRGRLFPRCLSRNVAQSLRLWTRL